MPYIGSQPTTAAFITDTFNGNGSTTAFTMSAAPANTNSILVAVSGVLQDPSTYSVSSTTLTFSAAPPSGTGNISVRFLGIPASGVVTTAYRTQTEFTATAGQTTFSVPSYTVGYIDVYRNGALLGSADFTATNGTTVVLTNAANAGDLVETVSFYVSSVVNAIPAVAGAVNSNYIANDVTINFADGSASTPSITNNGDTNTGIFFPAADTIAFAEGGVEAMRIDSSGNLLVGTTDGNFTNGIGIKIANSTSARLKLCDSDSGVGAADGFELTAAGVDSYIYNLENGFMAFGTNSAERMRIDSSGNLCLGISSQMNSGKQSIEFVGNTTNGITLRTTFASTGSNYLAFYNSANNVTGVIQQNGTTTVSYTTSSDYRLKENIAPITGALDKVAQLKPVTYKWKVDGSDGQGFIAHELQEIVPDCVVGEKDAVDADGNIKPQGVDTSFLVATLTAAIQELKAELDATKAEVQALKGAIE
jgi:hypothetical protein